jgi:GNAT superfamily N-acetyltransferase
MADPPTIVTRRGGAEDVDAMLEDVRVGFESYTEFAPAGWTPPNVRADRERTLDLLADSSSWLLLADVGGATAGHVALTRAREAPAGHASGERWRERTPVPGMVHLWQLFVRPAWWGTGVADVLHREFIAEATNRGYEFGRLYTPAAHERARRFYERRGWSALGEQFNQGLELTIAEYRREL